MQQIVIKVLPDGRVRHHWFVRDEQGPIKTPLRQDPTQAGVLRLGGAVGYIACQKRRQSTAPEVRGNQVVPLCHTDDPRAATCPDCLATPEYAAAMAAYAEIMDLPLSEAQLRAVAR